MHEQVKYKYLVHKIMDVIGIRFSKNCEHRFTKSNAAVFQQVAEVIKQGSLIVTADATKVTQEPTAAGNHLWKGNFLSNKMKERMDGAECTELNKCVFQCYYFVYFYL